LTFFYHPARSRSASPTDRGYAWVLSCGENRGKRPVLARQSGRESALGCMVSFGRMPLSSFHPIIANWFRQRFGAPTDVQAKSWPAIQSGQDVLIAAPTGSGKTLAAFLSCIDALFEQALRGELEDRTHVVYVSPLKALSNDVQKNLQQPLAEIADAALSAGLLMPELRVMVRTGDTPVWDRQQMLRRPPHILITTPESLYLLLTAEKSRKILTDVRTVIVDEIHALAPNKRGAHLALSLERLEAGATTRPVRIGLSATQRPIETIARFLVGQGKKRFEVRGSRFEVESGPNAETSNVERRTSNVFNLLIYWRPFQRQADWQKRETRWCPHRSTSLPRHPTSTDRLGCRRCSRP